MVIERSWTQKPVGHWKPLTIERKIRDTEQSSFGDRNWLWIQNAQRRRGGGRPRALCDHPWWDPGCSPSGVHRGAERVPRCRELGHAGPVGVQTVGQK